MPDELRFVGREKQIETFTSAVNSLKNCGKVLHLVGPAGCGKSALLQEFDRRCREDRKITLIGIVTVIRDEFSRFDDPISLFSRINRSWMREITSKSTGITGWVKKKHTYLDKTIEAIDKGTFTVIPDDAVEIPMEVDLPSIPGLPNNIALLFQAFFADLEEFSRNYPDKRLVFLLDGYDDILIEDIFNALFNDIIRNIQDLKNVMMVIASRKPLPHVEIEPLGTFEAYETRSFLKANSGLEDSKLLSRIHALLGGSPYYLSLLVHVLKEKKNKNEDVIMSLPGTYADDYVNRLFFESLPDGARSFLPEVCVLAIIDENAARFMINSGRNDFKIPDTLALLKKLAVLNETSGSGKAKHYRLHDIFRDFLMAANEISLPAMHLKAAEYYEHKIRMRLADEIEMEDVRAALYHSRESGNTDFFVKILNEHEIGLRATGNISELKYYFDNTDFEKISDEEVKSEAFHNYGVALYLKGDMQKALDMFEMSREIETKRGNKRETALIMHEIAMIYIDTREYDRALDMLEKAMHLEEIQEDHIKISATMQQIAMIYFVREEYDQALDRYEKSLEIISQTEDLTGAASILQQIANIYRKNGEFNKALDIYEKTLRFEEKLGDRRRMAYTTAQMGLVCFSLGRTDEAVRLLKAALEIFEKIGPEMAAEKIRARLETINESGRTG